MIEIKSLSHSFGKKLVLDNIDLTVPDGTVLGIVGINGAGKSTLLRLLAGVYDSKGCVLYDGKSPSLAKTRKDIFFLPDDPYYTATSTPEKTFAFYKAFYPNIDKVVFDSLISKYAINPKLPLRSFSKGMRRQVFIALALAAKPKYMLLDEAFDGLDPLSRKIFKDAIIKLVEDENTTVLISSHSLRELEDFCDKFVLIDNNKIKNQGDIAEHVASMCKFELAFLQEISKESFEGMPIVSLEIKGRFATVVLEGESTEMRRRLESLNPAVMDELPLDFEEAFIHDVESDRRE
ncbi:MAG: ABC transporter ATP-binding protein [Clostridia bacterium]|nr:ABC transporter ATP-binding protein [Clostridia bacterium]